MVQCPQCLASFEEPPKADTVKMTETAQLICALVLVLFTVIRGQEIGKACTVWRRESVGTCTKVERCNTYIQDLRNQRTPSICKTKGRFTGLACCPNEEVNKFSRISEEKCAEYVSAVYRNIRIWLLYANAKQTLVKKDKCGHAVRSLLVGREYAEDTEFPHMALIGYEDTEIKWTCCGSLISDWFVLTAGHCKSNKNNDAKYVRLGQINRSFANSKQFNIANFIVHPAFDPDKRHHDIGLVQLDRRVEFAPNIRPACLASSFDEADDKAIATGWGSIHFPGPFAHRLKKTVLEVYSYEDCKAYYQGKSKMSVEIDNRTQVCAGSRIEAIGPCYGDAGSPLQLYHDSRYCMYTIIGVNSFGASCLNVGIPGVYTKVATYLDWIEAIVWQGQF